MLLNRAVLLAAWAATGVNGIGLRIIVEDAVTGERLRQIEGSIDNSHTTTIDHRETPRPDIAPAPANTPSVDDDQEAPQERNSPGIDDLLNRPMSEIVPTMKFLLSPMGMLAVFGSVPMLALFGILSHLIVGPGQMSDCFAQMSDCFARACVVRLLAFLLSMLIFGEPFVSLFKAQNSNGPRTNREVQET